jgi:hypothetical protein
MYKIADLHHSTHRILNTIHLTAETSYSQFAEIVTKKSSRGVLSLCHCGRYSDEAIPNKLFEIAAQFPSAGNNNISAP